MKSVVVYESFHGNTKAVAEAIAKKLKEKGSVQLVKVNQLPETKLEGVGLFVMGCPTYAFNMPQTVKNILKQMPKDALADVPVAAFDTKMDMFGKFNNAASKLDKALRKLGGKSTIGPENFIVLDKEGPLMEGEEARAEAWAQKVLDTL